MHDPNTSSRGGAVRRSVRSSLYLPFSGVLLLSIVLILCFVVNAQARDALVVGDHTFEYLSVSYNDDGTSTWSYRVTSGNRPSLSHWVLEWDTSLGESNVVNASEIYEVNTEADLQQD